MLLRRVHLLVGLSVFTACADNTTTVVTGPPPPVTVTPTISAGAGSACAVTSSGTGYCWGENTEGQLGNGSTVSSASPVPIAGNVTFKSISIGSGLRFACGLTTAGAAYCWGDNVWGQLGNGSTANSTTPVPVGGGLTFQSLGVGVNYACGLTTAGAAYCWGANELNQFGIGSSSNSPNPAPVPVNGGLIFQALTVGDTFACGLTTAGTAYCWGTNIFGQLGLGVSNTTKSTPTLAAAGLRFTTISAGQEFMCGISVSGTTYCWGWNAFGELGQGTKSGPNQCQQGYSCAVNPVAVTGTFSNVVAGNESACAVTTAGAVQCWGDNELGELGTGNTSASLVPAPAMGGLEFSQVSVGFGLACGITKDGAFYCWGNNNLGGSGNGAVGFRAQPAVVTGGHTFQSIASGNYSTCAVTADSTAYCWGRNAFGELGNGTFADTAVPTPVTGSLRFGMVAISPYYTTCGIASGGTAYCWGVGQVGNTQDSVNTPVVVGGGLTFTMVSAGSCGVTNAAAAYCWSGSAGSSPTLVPGGLTWQSVTDDCGVTTSGAGYCWAGGSPTAISGGLTFASISGQCGLTTSGAVYCWGNNQYGQLGNGTTMSSSSPVLVSGGLTFISLSASGISACGITSTNSTYCWGLNQDGELGGWVHGQ